MPSTTIVPSIEELSESELNERLQAVADIYKIMAEPIEVRREEFNYRDVEKLQRAIYGVEGGAVLAKIIPEVSIDQPEDRARLLDDIKKNIKQRIEFYEAKQLVMPNPDYQYTFDDVMSTNKSCLSKLLEFLENRSEETMNEFVDSFYENSLFEFSFINNKLRPIFHINYHNAKDLAAAEEFIEDVPEFLREACFDSFFLVAFHRQAAGVGEKVKIFVNQFRSTGIEIVDAAEMKDKNYYRKVRWVAEKVFREVMAETEGTPDIDSEEINTRVRDLIAETVTDENFVIIGYREAEAESAIDPNEELRRIFTFRERDFVLHVVTSSFTYKEYAASLREQPQFYVTDAFNMFYNPEDLQTSLERALKQSNDVRPWIAVRIKTAKPFHPVSTEPDAFDGFVHRHGAPNPCKDLHESEDVEYQPGDVFVIIVH